MCHFCRKCRDFSAFSCPSMYIVFDAVFRPYSKHYSKNDDTNVSVPRRIDYSGTFHKYEFTCLRSVWRFIQIIERRQPIFRLECTQGGLDLIALPADLNEVSPPSHHHSKQHDRARAIEARRTYMKRQNLNPRSHPPPL